MGLILGIWRTGSIDHLYFVPLWVARRWPGQKLSGYPYRPNTNGEFYI